jgi:hypothetical protein
MVLRTVPDSIMPYLTPFWDFARYGKFGVCAPLHPWSYANKLSEKYILGSTLSIGEGRVTAMTSPLTLDG